MPDSRVAMEVPGSGSTSPSDWPSCLAGASMCTPSSAPARPSRWFYPRTECPAVRRSKAAKFRKLPSDHHMTDLPITSAFNDAYIAEMYEAFRRDPTSVDESWRQFFRFAQSLAGAGGAASFDESLLRKVASAAALVGAIQRYGHLAVQLDPLGAPPLGAAELKPEFHGITETDLAEIPASALADAHTSTQLTGTAADVVQHLRELYCGTIGLEFDHLEEGAERDWFRRAIEERQIN